MKHTILGFFVFTALALVALPSCEGIKGNCSTCQDADKNKVTISLGGDAVAKIRPSTKVVDVTEYDETNVESCRLFVFTQEGAQIDQWSAQDGNFEFYLADGVYEFLAVVNLDGLPDKKATRDEILATMVPIEKSSLGSFVMAGRLKDHIIKDDEKITIEVRRLASKVSFHIETAFEDYMAEYPFHVDGIYMTNIVGEVDLGLDSTSPADAGKWYDQMNFNQKAAEKCPWPQDMYYGKYDVTMENGDELTSGHVFYIYPNSSTDNHDKEVWGPRCTRFVIAATLNGRRTYYPVTLYDKDKHIGVRENKHYHINVTIKSWGYDHPEDEQGDYGAIAMTMTVSDWDDGSNVEKWF